MKHIRIIALSILVVVIILSCFSCIMLKYSLKPNKRAQNLEDSYAFIYKEYPYLEAWVDSLNFEKALKDTFIIAPDGVRLHAYYVQAAKWTDKTAVIIHGYTDNAIRMFMIGHMYSNNLGYNILLPDLRWAGQSDGTHIQMGWFDRLDVLQWIEIANKIYGDSTQMVIHGISMGAATTMMVSGEEVPGYVKCYVEDCGYTSVWDEFKHELKKRFYLPSFPAMNVTSRVCELKYGWNFKEASAINQIQKCDRPMFFIHGGADNFVPTWMVYDLYEIKSEPKELWVLPEVPHALSYKMHTEEYIRRVNEFISRYIH